MPFTPPAEKLLPDLTPREELVLLARTLWREGYDDHLAGHITISLGDGTLLCNPWLLTWDEIRPRDVIRIDPDGRVVLVLDDEYGGGVSDPNAAYRAIEAMGDTELALLAGHGVFLLGSTVRAVHQRAVALEQRCKHAWHVRAAAGPVASPLPDWYVERSRGSDGNAFLGFWEGHRPRRAPRRSRPPGRSRLRRVRRSSRPPPPSPSTLMRSLDLPEP